MATRKRVAEEEERRRQEGTAGSGVKTDRDDPIPTKKKEEQVELVKLSREEMEKHLAKVDKFENIPKEWRGKDIDVEASEKYGKPMVTTYKLPDGTTTTTKPPPERGWRVMLESLNIAFNPFSDKKGGIVATMGGKTFRSVAEFAGNHPYTAALAGTGVFMGAKVVAGKVAAGAATKAAAAKFAQLPVPQIGKINVINKAGRAFTKTGFVSTSGAYMGGGTASTYAANTATAKLTGNLLVKAGFSLIAGFYIVEKIGSTYPFSEFNISEAMQGLGIARYKAFEAGDQEAMDMLDKLQQEILNPVGWEAVISKLPWLNIQRSAAKVIQAQLASTEVFNKLLEKEQMKQAEGRKILSSEQFKKRIEGG